MSTMSKQIFEIFFFETHPQKEESDESYILLQSFHKGSFVGKKAIQNGATTISTATLSTSTRHKNSTLGIMALETELYYDEFNLCWA